MRTKGHLTLVGGTDVDTPEPMAFRILGLHGNTMGLSDGDGARSAVIADVPGTRELYEVVVLADCSTLARPYPPTPL